MQGLVRKHLPGGDIERIDDLALALHMEKQFWENMKAAVANGIAIAFNGE